MKNTEYNNGQYKKLSHIGNGTFGEVIKALDLVNNREVAIKILYKAKDSEELYNDNQNFMNEIKLLIKLKTPYTIQYYDSFEDEESFYIVMELCDESLEDYLERIYPKCLEKKEIQKIFYQLNVFLYKMRQNKISHRDLKGENILIKYTNKEKTNFDIRVTDFGLGTKIYNFSTQHSICGTDSFMAPEVETLIYNDKCDLWSLGVILYELIFNEYIFDGKSEKKRIELRDNGIIPKLPEDEELKDLLLKLIVVKVEDRISWDDYFNHSLFTSFKYEEEPSDNLNYEEKFELTINTSLISKKTKIQNINEEFEKKSDYMLNIELNKIKNFNNDPSKLICYGDFPIEEKRPEKLIIFESLKKEIILIFSYLVNSKEKLNFNTYYNIDCYNLTTNQLIKRIYKAHTEQISFIKHYYDINRDIVLTLSVDNTCVIYDMTNNWKVIVNKKNIGDNRGKRDYMYPVWSACLYFDKENNKFLITSCFDDKVLKVFNFNSELIKKINNAIQIRFVDIEYDKKTNKNYIITYGNYNSCSFEYDSGEIFNIYNNGEKYITNNVLIKEIESKKFLIETNNKGFLNFYDFYSGNKLFHNNYNNMALYKILDWNSNYLLISTNNRLIVFDIKSKKFIKELFEELNIDYIDKFIHPDFGESLMTKNLYGGITMWSF